MPSLADEIEGHKVAVTLPKARSTGLYYYKNSLVDYLEEKGFEVLKIPFPETSDRIPLNDTISKAVRIRKRVKRSDADSVVFTDFSHCMGLNPRRLDKKTFLTFHHPLNPGNLYQKLTYRLIILRLEQADRVIATSDYTKDYVKNRFGLSSVTYDQGVKDFPEGELPENVKKPFLLYVGTHHPRKNIPLMLDSFEKILDKHPELSLVMAGKHRGADYTRDLIKEKSLQDRVIITGEISESKLGKLYKEAEVYVHTAEEEGYSRTIREARKKGTPVVAVENDLMREVLPKRSICESDPDSVRKKVSELLGDTQDI